LQEILEQINSNYPDSEVFALMYAFEFKKHATVSHGAVEIKGEASKRHKPPTDRSVLISIAV